MLHSQKVGVKNTIRDFGLKRLIQVKIDETDLPFKFCKIGLPNTTFKPPNNLTYEKGFQFHEQPQTGAYCCFYICTAVIKGFYLHMLPHLHIFVLQIKNKNVLNLFCFISRVPFLLYFILATVLPESTAMTRVVLLSF